MNCCLHYCLDIKSEREKKNTVEEAFTLGGKDEVHGTQMYVDYKGVVFNHTGNDD